MTGRRFKREERTVVPNLAFPMTVEIVGHDIEEVDVLDHLWDVVSGRNGLGTSRYSGR